MCWFLWYCLVLDASKGLESPDRRPLDPNCECSNPLSPRTSTVIQLTRITVCTLKVSAPYWNKLNGVLSARMGESCLYLNVWAPSSHASRSNVTNGSSKAALPVLFWIHGGSFVMGGTSEYSGDALFKYRHDFVLVTANCTFVLIPCTAGHVMSCHVMSASHACSITYISPACGSQHPLSFSVPAVRDPCNDMQTVLVHSGGLEDERSKQRHPTAQRATLGCKIHARHCGGCVGI